MYVCINAKKCDNHIYKSKLSPPISRPIQSTTNSNTDSQKKHRQLSITGLTDILVKLSTISEDNTSPKSRGQRTPRCDVKME